MAHEILTTTQMAEADRRTIAAGTPGIVLMERAGLAVAEAIAARWTVRPVAVLCGPGNNGGDGYVIARRLRDWGWPVTVAPLGDPARLRGDAAIAAARWGGPLAADAAAALHTADLAVDALFGAGLARPLDGAAAELVGRLAAAGCPVVAVDMPSGVHGDTGAVWGVAAAADLTVTFARRKIGHVIGEGLLLSGPLLVADIGIADRTIADLDVSVFANHPELWPSALTPPHRTAHKYARGHVVVRGGVMTGAARLAAQAARRIGAGLVTAVAAPGTDAVLAADAPGTIVAEQGRWPDLLHDPRVGVVVIGPGAGRTQETRRAVVDAARAGKPLVLDADALTVFEDDPDALFAVLTPADVLTPHAGEFGRLFGAADGSADGAGADGADKVTGTRQAARRAGAVVLHKGADTVVADPTGMTLIETSGPPGLATAGAGDVLAGMIAGLRAQGLPPTPAAAAAARLHADAARRGPARLIAEDLISAIRI